MNSWYKLKIKAHGNSFDFYFNDTYQNTSTDNTFSAGAIGLFGEQGTTAQFNDIRVRKYAATEPVTAVRGTQFNGFQWTGEGGSSAWNNASNWFSCTVPPALSDVAIFNGPFDPVISGITVTCNNLVIEPSGSLTINEDGGLTAASITINSSSASNGGSLINYGTNTLTATYNRFLRPESNYGDRHFFSSPVGGQLVSGFITTNQSKIHQIEGVYQIWSYKETDGSWPIVSSGVLESGTGYNIDQATGSDGLLAFTGSVVKTASFLATSPYANYNGNPRSSRADYGDPAYTTDENIWEYPRTWTNYGGGGWNLMGNPFTSALDAAEFVSENTGKFDPNYLALYLYDGNSATPRYRYAAAAVPFDPGYEEGGFFNENIQTGQGFFVLALHNELWFDFTPAMQIHNNGVTMLKSADTQDPWPGLRLKVKYGNNESQTTIIYNNAMTTGLDPGYDVGQLSAGPDVEVYTSLLVKDNSVNYARQALPLTDYGKNVIPVGIDTENGGEVTFSAYAVPIENSKFWLEDRVTGTYTDLTSGSYTVTLPAKTYGTGRFYIIASANTPTGIEKPGSDDADLRVWTSNGKLIIKGEVSGRAMCEIYDLRGQKIMETNLLDNYLNTVTLPSGLRGVYLVRVVDGVQIMTQKVALF